MSDPSAAPAAPASAEATQSGGLAEDIRKQVETEQALVDAQRKLKELEEELERIRKDKAVIETERDASNSTTEQLRTQLTTLQSSHFQVSSQLSVSQTRLDAIDREKRELIDEIEKLQQRSKITSQDLHTLRTQRAETSSKIAQLEVDVSGLKMSAESSKFNEQRALQSLQNAQSQMLTLNQATADVEERFAKYRAEKQSELSNLQLDNDTLLARITAADNSYNALKRVYDDQTRRLVDAETNIANLTSSAAARKAASTNELNRLLDENRILEKRADEARATIADREAELERLSDAQETKERSWEDKWKKEERSRREAEKRAEDLKVVVDRLTLAHGEGTDISPAAALAAEQRMSGKSYTQFYIDYTTQSTKLREAELEVDRLTELLDEISADINEKKPLLDEQAAEHSAAIERANTLAAELATALTTRDLREAEAKALRAESTMKSEESQSLRSTADDLSRQVQTLLRQIAVLNDPSLVNASIDANTTISEGDIISDHLVEFQSIRALQEQNQRLLKLTRQLMAKLNSQEVARAADDENELETGVTLDKATETITRLHQQLVEAQKKISEVTRERDTFSKLLARGEGLRAPAQIANGNGPLDDSVGPQQELVSTLQEELHKIRSQAEKDVSEIRAQLSSKAAEVGEAELGKARAQTQINLLQEQYKTLLDASSLQKVESHNLETQLRQVQASITQANNEKRQALEQAATKQGEADRFRNEAAALRAEKEQWKSTQNRLENDLRQVQTERARVQSLMDGLSNVNVESERTRSDERVKLEKRVEELQKEIQEVRKQLEQAKEATRAAEKRSADFDARLETATAAMRAEKAAAESLAEARRLEIETKTKQLETTTAESETRKRIGLNHQRRSNEARAEIEKKDNEIKELSAKMQTVEKEIADAKAKITELEKKLSDAEAGSQRKDATVSRLQADLAAANAKSSGGQAKADDQALNALRIERDSLQQRLTQTEKDLADAKAASSASATGTTGDGASTAGDSAREELQKLYDQLKADKEALDSKYENDVTRVNRSNQGLMNRVNNLVAKNGELEKSITDLKNATPSASAAPADQANIDEAVRAAVQAKEAELRAELSKPAGDDEAKKAELETTLQTRLKEAIAAKAEEMEKEKADLKKEIDELQGQVNKLSRQNKTGEITRKTLERQKQEAEAKLKKIEEEHGSSTSAVAPTAIGVPATTPVTAAPTAPTAALSGDAAAFKPGQSADPVANPFGPKVGGVPPANTPTPTENAAGPSTGLPPAAAVPTGPAAASPTAPARGGARGRGTRGAARGARGGRASNILSTVNATLGAAASTPSATTTPAAPTTGAKRPAPEEGEISDNNTAAGTAAPATGPRVLKRPKGLGPRASQAGSGEIANAGASDTTSKEGGAGGEAGSGNASKDA